MAMMNVIVRHAVALGLMFSVASLETASAGGPENTGPPAARSPPLPVDHSGRKQTGVASYYGKHSVNKKTANGDRFDPGKMTAASKTLPLGTRAKVTNKENGKSAEVTINDRGPFVEGRILDVTPKAADKLGMTSDGVSEVEVKPLSVPQADGQTKHMSR